mmetsp:Transcript_123731/g.395927  ORF Transcript_123731/g.395927 Transcript_123731/m.395927 type:complete len:230 (+) Transcript_123731:836-1525(+)
MEPSPAGPEGCLHRDAAIDRPSAQESVEEDTDDRDSDPVAAVVGELLASELLPKPRVGGLPDAKEQHQQRRSQHLVEQRPKEVPKPATSDLSDDAEEELEEVEDGDGRTADDDPIRGPRVHVKEREAQAQAERQGRRGEQNLRLPAVHQRLKPLRDPGLLCSPGQQADLRERRLAAVQCRRDQLGLGLLHLILSVLEEVVEPAQAGGWRVRVAGREWVDEVRHWHGGCR